MVKKSTIGWTFALLGPTLLGLFPQNPADPIEGCNVRSGSVPECHANEAPLEDRYPEPIQSDPTSVTSSTGAV